MVDGSVSGDENLLAGGAIGQLFCGRRELSSSQSAISKRVMALESRLNCRLLQRSSRQLRLTDDGERYYRFCLSMLPQLDQLESELAGQQEVTGSLKITAPVALGQRLLLPHLQQFMALYPKVNVALSLSDAQADLIREGIDVAFRVSQLADSALVARKLFDNPVVYVASPSYLRAHGTPETAQDLKHHQGLCYSLMAAPNRWRLGDTEVAIDSRFSSDNADLLLQMAIDGFGICALPEWMVAPAIARQQLQPVLTTAVPASLPLYLIFANRQHLPKQVRLFIDFMAERLQPS